MAQLQSTSITGSLIVTGGITGSFSGSIASPGSNTQVLFNNSGVISANSGFVYSSGNVGINTASPLAILSVGNGTLADTNVPIQISSEGTGTQKWIGVNKNGNYGLLIGYIETGGLAGNGAYIRQITSDPLHFLVNSTTAAMTMVSSGNIGIGTTGPTSTLTITDGATPYAGATGIMIDVKRNVSNGNDTTSRSGIRLGNNSNGFQIFYGGTTDRLRFIDGGGVEMLTLVNGGNIGIGTTNPAGQLSGTKGLSIVDATNAALGLSNGTNHWLNYLSGTTYRIWNNTSSEVMTITLAGLVGIGTVTPARKLNVRVSPGSTVEDGVIINDSAGDFLLSRTGASYTYRGVPANASMIYSNTALALLSDSPSSRISFHNDSGEYARFTSGGNFLIGTTSDAGYKLRVNGSSYFDSPILCYTGNGYITALTNDGVGSNNGFGYSFLINNNGHEIGRLTGIYETSGGGGSGGIGFWTRGSGTLSNKMILNSGGTLTLNSYGSGTKTGTVAYNLAVDSSGNVIETAGGVVDGSGTANYVPLWQDANTLTNSTIYQNGSNIGVGTTNATGRLTVAPYNTVNSSSIEFTGTDNAVISSYYSQVIAVDNTNTQSGRQIVFAKGGKGYGTQTKTMMVIDADSGNVGIGITSPASKLDLYNGTDLGLGANGIRVQRPGAYGQYGYLEYLPSSDVTVLGSLYTGGGASVFGQIYFRQHSSTTSRDIMVINSSGNVGIGTTNPSGKLHVYQSSATDTYLESGTSGTTGKLYFKTSDNSDLNKYIMQEAYYMVFGGHANEGFKFRDSASNVLMTVFGSNNAYGSRVGIGTSTPSQKLDVAGQAAIGSGAQAIIGTDGTYAGYSTIGFGGTTNGYNRVFGNNGTGDGLYLSAATGNGIWFWTNGSNLRMHISPTGLVGIGTSSPSQLLHVNGRALVDQFQYTKAIDYSSGDLNSLVTAGFYNGSSMTNAPQGNSGWFYITVETYSGDNNWIHQTATTFGSGNTANEVYTRVRASGTWGSWKELTSNTGTVTSVGGTGTVNGITLTGTVTTSGNLTLGGTLGSIANSQLTNSSITVGSTAISLGASATTIAGLSSVTSTTFVGALTGNASTSTNLSTDRTNWNTNGTISAVVGQLAWKNYGNSHTIFDASNSTAPNGGAISNTNPDVAWTSTYPTLMGWNGANTYGVRVDSARTADSTSAVSGTTNYVAKFTSGTAIGNSQIFDNGTNVGIGTTSPGAKLEVNGSFRATTKSFIIDHPTKEGKKLQYGVLEGPEHSVYVRGKLTNTHRIELPDYWYALVDEDSITVNLTAIGKRQELWVEEITDKYIMVGSETAIINCFYTVFAERKDVEKLVTEFDKE